MRNYKPSEFAERIGVNVKTLQRWDREGLLKAKRTPSNRRYYDDNDIKNYLINGYTDGLEDFRDVTLNVINKITHNISVMSKEHWSRGFNSEYYESVEKSIEILKNLKKTLDSSLYEEILK